MDFSTTDEHVGTDERTGATALSLFVVDTDVPGLTAQPLGHAG
jgi:hypothetical protein